MNETTENKPEETSREAAIPFSGFYNSLLSSAIDSELEEISKDRGKELEDYGTLPDDYYNYLKIEHEVARQWTTALQDLITEITGIPVDFQFKLMTSPKFFNFETDRVFVDVEFTQLEALYNWLDKALLTAMAKRMFRSYDGFCSFYDEDWTTWGDITTWDHNQWLCVIRAITETKDEWLMHIYYDLDFYSAVSEGVDWKKLDTEHPVASEDDGYKGEKA